ncbi:VWA domain-containing protein [Spirosoma taeanense]|uniref:VWA domain-containing protein n=1 Tax=Spirosoma taeanense TaxID=2735870 RepID=A0A6M5YBZ3_9BACT|nr:VWA domain-containing protein [Spirosoma taeanense]QJW90771.1 VWA domain-containing protein [Spirosoma taeanense]
MNWLYSFSSTDFFLIGLFIGLYALYIFRTFRLARQLNTSAWGVIPKFFLRSSYLALLLIALLGPSFGEAERNASTTGRDVYLLVDVSRSMNAGDVVPTRLERVKYDIQQLCDTLPADRFGLILTAGESFVLSPLTADHDALKRFVRDIRTNAAASSGTDLCTALELARQKFLTDSSTQQSARALVLFSDGENFGTCDRMTLMQLRTASLPLITVGVGTEAGASIREGRDFVRDDARQIVRSRLNRTFLQELARAGRGQYIEADASGQYVNELASVLRAQQGRVSDQNQVAVSTNKYYYFLLAALVLLAFDLIITVRTFRL